ncbi:MAG: fimbrillin family protein [Bacteroidaceae bacterium]|nr:fimbrillin family protein [Bacteroidaceae bacterium]
MKKFITKVTVLLSLLTVVGCSEEALIENTPFSNNDGTIKEICITGKNFLIDSETRSSVSITESGASFTWDEDDVIGIFPNEGDQVSFAMSEGAGTQTATFSGGGWALKSSATYAAYYPHVYENRDMTKIPVSYLGQTQNGNNNTAHIGTYDFMAASVATPSNGVVAFDMQHLGCLVQLKITMPEKKTLSSVTLSADEEIFVEKGYIDLSVATPSIVPTQTTSSLKLDLKNVTTTAANEDVVINFMMAPVDMSGKTLTIRNGNAEAKVNAKNFEKGKAYQLVAQLAPLPQVCEAIDLGLSVKWATCNVGATKPEEFGGHYAWGETEEKENYSWETYKWCNGSYYKMTKYCTNSNYGTVDNKTTLDLKDDVANVKWGGSWRMPTSSELKELSNNCIWEWTTLYGVSGYNVTGPNGNSIFLPAARRSDDTALDGCDGLGYYWSSSLHNDYNNNAYSLDFDGERYGRNYNYRNYRQSVRPVCD